MIDWHLHKGVDAHVSLHRHFQATASKHVQEKLQIIHLKAENKSTTRDSIHCNKTNSKDRRAKRVKEQLNRLTIWFDGTSSPSYFGPSTSSPPRPYLIFQLSILSAIFCFWLRFPDEHTKSLATSSESPSSSPSPWIGGLPVKKIQTITSYTFHAPKR